MPMTKSKLKLNISWPDKIHLTVLAIILLSSNYLPNYVQTASAQVLQGGIEERVAPVQERFRIGSTFSEDLLPGNHKIKSWYKLPDWLTGGFEAKTLKQTIMLRSVESKNETKSTRGLQADKTGAVWDAVIIPNYARVKTQGATDFDIFEDYQVLDSQPDSFRCLIRYTAITVDDETHKILRAEKRTEEQELQPASSGKVVEHSLQMRYDQDGKAITRKPKKLEVNLLHTSPFVAQDQSPGGTFNYKEEFRAYLTESGQSSLIPD